jgi:hypothetical protein
MSFFPLISIPILFLLAALMKPVLQKLLPFNLCAICVSVSLTWIILLTLWLLGAQIDTVSIGVLMGMSVTGLMYKMEEAYKKNRLNHLWAARLTVILGGFLTITLLLGENRQGALLAGIGTLLLLVIISFLIQGTTHRDAVESAPGDVKKSLLKKLDNCC